MYAIDRHYTSNVTKRSMSTYKIIIKYTSIYLIIGLVLLSIASCVFIGTLLLSNVADMTTTVTPSTTTVTTTVTPSTTTVPPSTATVTPSTTTVIINRSKNYYSDLKYKILGTGIFKLTWITTNYTQNYIRHKYESNYVTLPEWGGTHSFKLIINEYVNDTIHTLILFNATSNIGINIYIHVSSLASSFPILNHTVSLQNIHSKLFSVMVKNNTYTLYKIIYESYIIVNLPKDRSLTNNIIPHKFIYPDPITDARWYAYYTTENAFTHNKNFSHELDISPIANIRKNTIRIIINIYKLHNGSISIQNPIYGPFPIVFSNYYVIVRVTVSFICSKSDDKTIISFIGNIYYYIDDAPSLITTVPPCVLNEPIKMRYEISLPLPTERN